VYDNANYNENMNIYTKFGITLKMNEKYILDINIDSSTISVFASSSYSY